MPRLLPRTLSGRLCLALNMTMLVLVVGFSVWDFSATVEARLRAKGDGLQDEAQMLTHALGTMGRPGRPAIQAYIDAVCQDMRERSSPGHYILVDVGGEEIEAVGHVRAMTASDRGTIRLAAEEGGRQRLHGKPVLARSAASGPVRVYVAEYTSDIREAVHRGLVRRLVGLVAATLVLAVVLNVSVYWLVRLPVRRLGHAIRQVGRGQLDAEAPLPAVTELRRLSRDFNRMSQALARSERDRQERLDRAKRIQRKIMPRPHQAQGFRVDGYHRPADTVAGDYWDIFECSGTGVLVCVADVSGHGVPAAMEAAMLKVLVTDATACSPDPAAMLARINRRYAELTLDDDFATMLLVGMAPGEDGLIYASAGHEEAILIHADQSEPDFLEATGPPIGISPDITWTSRARPFAPGDKLIAVTDGVAEASAPDGTMFGRDRLADTLLAQRDLPLDQLIIHLRDTVLAHLAGHNADDDMTIVGVER